MVSPCNCRAVPGEAWVEFSERCRTAVTEAVREAYYASWATSSPQEQRKKLKPSLFDWPRVKHRLQYEQDRWKRVQRQIKQTGREPPNTYPQYARWHTVRRCILSFLDAQVNVCMCRSSVKERPRTPVHSRAGGWVWQAPWGQVRIQTPRRGRAIATRHHQASPWPVTEHGCVEYDNRLLVVG